MNALLLDTSLYSYEVLIRSEGYAAPSQIRLFELLTSILGYRSQASIDRADGMSFLGESEKNDVPPLLNKKWLAALIGVERYSLAGPN